MTDSSAKEPRMWEKAWTPDEIRKNSANWTLAGDSGLLNGMESLAQNLLMKTQEMQKQVDSLSQETRATGSRLHNAITDFLMLSNVQFVENRVYDEEVLEEILNNENKIAKKTKEEREAELVPLITEAVKFGLNVVENAFEKHQVIDSDSEEEEDNSFHPLPVLKPKDFYSHRPLPYVIGSDKFMRDDYAGLEETDEEDESEIDEIHEQIKDESDESTEDSEMEETDGEKTTNKTIISDLNPKKSDNEEDGELFGIKHSDDGFSSEDDANSDTSNPQATTAQANFAAELAAKLGVSQQLPANTIEQNDKEDVKDLKSNKRKESKAKEISDEDEEDSLFKRKNSLFGSGGGLFDDLNDDENDLFSEVKAEKSNPKDIKRKESKPIEKSQRKSSLSLFDDVEDDLFSSVKMDEDKKTRKSSIVNKPQEKKRSESKTLSLFEDADDEDDDLFTTTTRRKSQSIHVEKDDDLFDSPTKRSLSVSSTDGTPKKKLPGAVPMIGSLTNPMAELFKARNLSESEKEVPDSTPKEDKTIIKKPENDVDDILASGDSVKTDEIKKEKSKSRTISLFDDYDDDEDDLFKHVKPEMTKTKESKETISSDSSKTSSIFDTEEENTDEIFEKKVRSKSLFDEENILFGGTTEDEPSVDLFKSPEKTETKEKTKSTSLFDTIDDDQDLFAASKTPIPAPRKQSAPKESANQSELPLKSNEIESSPTKKKLTGGILLFGGIDPFGGSSSNKEAKDVESTKQMESSKQTESSAKNKPRGPSLSMTPLTHPDEIAISFDKPPEPNTLKSTCKNRATVQKRRPPTRKGRIANVESKKDKTDENNVLSSPDEPLNEVNNILSPSTEEEDVLTVDELLESKVKPTLFNQNGGNKETKKDDLFAHLDEKNVDEDDDLFSSKTRKNPVKKDLGDLFGGSTFEAKKTVASLFDDDSEDDIFADVKTTKNTKSKPKEQIVNKKSKGLFDDDDDDVSIFDDPLMVKRGN